MNATETCPGHSTILTGSLPSRSGIIANNWFDLSQARSDKAVYCAEDERVPGSSSSKYTVSPVHLKVPTLGELMKRANPASRSVAVAGKDRAAVMMSGQRPDQRWYWDGKTYATDLAGVTVPASVARRQPGGRRADRRARAAADAARRLRRAGARRSRSATARCRSARAASRAPRAMRAPSAPPRRSTA